MPNRLRPAYPAIALAFLSQPLEAQLTAPPIVSAMPDMHAISPANAAGVLHYCRSHHLVSMTASDVVLEKLKATPGLASSPDYSAGEGGRIISGSKGFELKSTTGYLRSHACDKVLAQAKHFK